MLYSRDQRHATGENGTTRTEVYQDYNMNLPGCQMRPRSAGTVSSIPATAITIIGGVVLMASFPEPRGPLGETPAESGYHEARVRRRDGT